MATIKFVADLSQIEQAFRNLGNMAANPLGAAGTLTSAFGNNTTTAAITGFTNTLISASNSLSQYNSHLFATMTQVELTMMGFRYKLAEDVGPALSKFMKKLMELVAAMEPLIAKFINFVADVMTPLIDGLMHFVRAIQVTIAALQVLWAYIQKMTSGGITGMFQSPSAARKLIGAGQLDAFVRPDKENMSAWEHIGNDFMGAMAGARMSDEDTKRMLALRKQFREEWEASSTNPAMRRSKSYEQWKVSNYGDPEVQDANKYFNDNYSKKTLENNLTDSIKNLDKTMKEFLGPTKAIADAMLRDGTALSLALHNSLGAWSHDKNAKDHGFQGTGQFQIPASPYMLMLQQMFGPVPGHVPDGKDPVTKFLRNHAFGVGSGIFGSDAGVFPMADRGPVSFQMNETVHIQAHEEDSVRIELMENHNMVMSNIRNLMDGRWRRLALDRNLMRQG